MEWPRLTRKNPFVARWQIRSGQPCDEWELVAGAALDFTTGAKNLLGFSDAKDARNTLFYGDNLAILREHIGDESVDLIYFGPPFNSNASYNVLFGAPDGHHSQAALVFWPGSR